MTPSQAAEGVPTLEEQMAWITDYISWAKVRLTPEDRSIDVPACDAILASLRRLSTQNTEGWKITDRNGVTAELKPTIGIVSVYDTHGNCFGTGPTGLMHHLYRSCEDKPYVPPTLASRDPATDALPYLDEYTQP